ncbi:MAG: translation initiation factor 2 [Desulfovibrio sp.]|nr:translation initiation factor 2 [Desulfovibrio sp.]
MSICRSLLLCLLFLPLPQLLTVLLPPPDAQALTLRRNLPTSARDMEFYYRHSRTEVIPGLLRSLDAENRFARGELKLVTAAFLSEIFKKNGEEAKKLLVLSKTMSSDCQKTMVWAVHLSGNPDLDREMEAVGLSPDAGLRTHLAHSPRDLLSWNICQSASALHMFWGAFFATGDERFLAPMVNAAILLGNLKSQGLTKDPRFKGAMDVAASLYEMTPRHTVLASYLKKRLASLSGPSADTLRTILEAN